MLSLPVLAYCQYLLSTGTRIWHTVLGSDTWSWHLLYLLTFVSGLFEGVEHPASMNLELEHGSVQSSLLLFGKRFGPANKVRRALAIRQVEVQLAMLGYRL